MPERRRSGASAKPLGEALNRARGWEERTEYKEPPRLH